MAKQKKVPPIHNDKSHKVPRIVIPGVVSSFPIWAFCLLDLDGPWCWSQMDKTQLLEVMARLRMFESMTWTAIEQSTRSHFVNTEGLIKKAQDRLTELRQDDVDELFSLRVNGKSRVWGIRSENILKVLWWDPSHEVYPSILKHT